MDVSQYLEIFIEESKEHLQNLNESLLKLEKEPEQIDIVNEIFRAAHTLKGMSATMGFKRMQKLTHNMENLLAEIRTGKISVSSNMLDILFQCIDAIETYLNNIIGNGAEGDDDNTHLVEALDNILNQTEIVNTVSELATTTTGNDDKDQELRKHLSLEIKEFEENAIKKAYAEGYRVYGVTIHIQETCILKAARAFIIFRTLENLGQIIKSNPDVQDIEDERFDFSFSVFVVSKESEAKIMNDLTNIAEIKAVLIDEMLKSNQDEVSQEEKTMEEVAATTLVAEVKTPKAAANATKGTSSKPIVNRSVRVDIDKLDVLMNLVSELLIVKNGLETYENSANHNFNEQIEYLERITTSLHESVMKVRMVPIESVFNRFPRMLRDLAKNLNKKFQLYMSGEETELDRTVIDEIGDPLVHLLRNAADHGLETPEARIKAGKDEEGSIYLEAYQDGNNVVIEIRDDGHGIDIDSVRRKAIEKGVITSDIAHVMTDKEIIDLLFRPSFSTAEKISDVSGRGVGLDVVKTKIEALGGDIEVRTQKGLGSTFIIRLPLTLAIIQALMVELGAEKYAIPLNSIRTIEDIRKDEIKYVQSKEVIHLRGSVIPIIRLGNVLDVESTATENESITVVIVNKGDRQAGFVVDNLIGQQEIVIKSLGKYLNSSKMIAGATILGDGEVALILDVNTLV